MIELPPAVKSPGTGEKFQIGPLAITSLVAPEQSGGAFEMYELALGVATVDYHIHRRMDETIYVVEGEIEFNVAGEKFLSPPGAVAFIKHGLHHGFSNLGPAPAKVIIVFTPNGSQQEYFRAAQALFKSPTLDTTALRELQVRYDQELIPAAT
jgi:quercetin dioxygenase-like cupin family protein